MPGERLELSCPKTYAPEAHASTNFAIPANLSKIRKETIICHSGGIIFSLKTKGKDNRAPSQQILLSELSIVGMSESIFLPTLIGKDQ